MVRRENENVTDEPVCGFCGSNDMIRIENYPSYLSPGKIVHQCQKCGRKRFVDKVITRP